VVLTVAALNFAGGIKCRGIKSPGLTVAVTSVAVRNVVIPKTVAFLQLPEPLDLFRLRAKNGRVKPSIDSD